MFLEQSKPVGEGWSQVRVLCEEAEAQRDRVGCLNSLGRRGGVRIQTHVFSQSSVYLSQLLALSREVMSPPSPAHM